MKWNQEIEKNECKMVLKHYANHKKIINNQIHNSPSNSGRMLLTLMVGKTLHPYFLPLISSPHFLLCFAPQPRMPPSLASSQKAVEQTTALNKTIANLCACVSVCVWVCLQACAHVCVCAQMCVHVCVTHLHACTWKRTRQRSWISTRNAVAKCIIYQNNESHLCLLTF